MCMAGWAQMQAQDNAGHTLPTVKKEENARPTATYYTDGAGNLPHYNVIVLHLATTTNPKLYWLIITGAQSRSLSYARMQWKPQ